MPGGAQSNDAQAVAKINELIKLVTEGSWDKLEPLISKESSGKAKELRDNKLSDEEKETIKEQFTGLTEKAPPPPKTPRKNSKRGNAAPKASSQPTIRMEKDGVEVEFKMVKKGANWLIKSIKIKT